MTAIGGDGPPTDERIVAYLDDEMTAAERAQMEGAIAADPRVAARVTALARPMRGLRQAFGPLLAEAPTARLEQMLSAVTSREAEAPVARDRVAGGWHRRNLLAAGIALIAFGGLADHLAFAPRPAADGAGHWRAVVADYMRLYTPQTLADIPDDPTLRAQELATVSGEIGLRLTPAAIAVGGISLKHSQILQYDQTSLAQITYLDPRYGPMALCIVQSDVAPAPPRIERRRGLDVVYWNDGRHGFMMIGASPGADLAVVATSIARRIAAIAA